MMDYEATINSIGGFGFYQKTRLCLMGFILMASGIQTLLNVIILYVPKYKCSTNQTLGNMTYNVSTDQCYLYSNTSHGAEERFSCDSWHYDDTDVVATAATDMNFVCENSGIIPLTSMVYVCGIFAASLTGGLLSDWKGRKLTQVIIQVIQILSTIPLYFITSSDFLIVLRFFGGIASNGTFVTLFVLALEIIPSTYGAAVGMSTHIISSFGQVVVITIAYFTREWHLLSLVVTAIFCIFLILLLMAVTTVYYGLVFGSSNLVGDLYVSTLLLAVVELIAYILLIFLLKKWGRKPLYCSSLILAGISCFVSGFVKVWAKDIRWLSILLLLIGKFAASASFAVIYNFTIEMFPTIIRNSVLGVSSCFGRFGSMAAPYILAAGTEMTSKIGIGLPVILFGILAIVAGLLSLFLPETKGYSLPDTFEEGENIGRKINHKVNGNDNNGMDWTGDRMKD
ncbi:organic cation transporter protein isoform X2 [Argonauta hians]